MRSIIEVKSIIRDKYFKPLEDFNDFYWVSGGVIADTFIDRPINDVDIFFPSKDSQEKARQHMLHRGFYIARIDYAHYKLTNGTIDYDLFHTWSSPEETVAKHDYEHCCVTIDKNLNFIPHHNFFERLRDRKLVPANPSNFGNYDERKMWPVAIIRRLSKLLKKGYTIDNNNLEIVCQKVVDLQDERRRLKTPP